MANEQKKVSELATSNSMAGTDRVVILKDPSATPSTRTITLTNLANSLPIGNSTVAGVYKLGSGLYVSANSIAVNSSYTAANSSNWGGSAPTTVSAALDRLAAAVVALGQTP